ncbi:MAG TPA: hypothetical protein VEP66_09680 [Myxococcales bacterium]|nr:hypothetical protein [Myxococcales bacterium]
MPTDGDELSRKDLPPGSALRIVDPHLPSVTVELPSSGSREARSPETPQRSVALHHLRQVWLQLRGDWTWLAVVPGEPDLSTADFAHALSQVGAGLSAEMVGFVEASDVDLESGSWLIDRLGNPPGDPARSPARTLVSLANPISNPFALPVTKAADGVILCVRRGRTPLPSIRETIEAVGPDHVVCSVLVG